MTAAAPAEPPSPVEWLRRNQGSAYLAVLVTSAFFIPSNLVISAIGGNGSPARLLSFVALLLLLTAWLRPAVGDRSDRPDPGVLLLVAFLASCFVSFSVAHLRLLESTERTGATRGLLTSTAIVGVALFAAVMLRRRDEIDRVITVTAVGVTFSAFIGILQSRINFDFSSVLRLPGFSISVANVADIRNDFVRVLGTTINPIEFAVIVGSVAPIGFHLATFGQTGWRRRLGIVCSICCTAAVPLAVSRSGILALGVSLMVYGATWTWRRRINAIVLAVVGTLAFRLIQPGLLGTIQGLFVNAGDDTSIQSRTEDYPRIFALADQSVWFGRGLGTFRPDDYFFLDNQWLLTFVESGIVGGLFMFALFVVPILLVQDARRRSTDPSTRSLCQAVIATNLAFGVSAFTFDMYSFQQSTLIAALFIGVGCALRATAVSGGLEPRVSSAPAVPVPVSRR